MPSKTDSDATYRSGTKDVIKIQPVRRSQRLSQLAAKRSPMHNVITLTQGIFSDTDIREDNQDTHDTLTLQQKSTTVYTKFIKTLSDKLKCDPYSSLAPPWPLHNTHVSTQAIFSTTDIKDVLNQNKSVKCCHNYTKTELNRELRSIPTCKLPSPNIKISTPHAFSITDINDFSASHETLRPLQKPITVSRKRTKKKSRNARSKPYTKICSAPYNGNILSSTDIKYRQERSAIASDTVTGELESTDRECQNSDDVPLDLSTIKSKEYLSKTLMTELDPIKSLQLNNNIQISVETTSNSTQQTKKVETSKNTIEKKSKKRRRPTKLTIKKRRGDNVKRKRNQKVEFVQYCENSTKMQTLKGMPQKSELFNTSMLPDIYPPHFKYQLPPEVALTQPLFPTQPNIMTPDDTQSLELKDSMSSSPSLPESLRGIFGTDDLRQLLDIEKYHLYDYHIQALAMVLNIREEFLRDILQKIIKINPNSLRKINTALKSPFVKDRDLFKRTTSTEFESPSSDAVSNSPVQSSRFLKIC